MYVSTCKTHPVWVCSDSGTVFTLLGLTGYDPGRFFRLDMGDDVSMRHSYLGQARLLGHGKWPKMKNCEISDFEEKPVFLKTRAKLSRPPYPFGPKKCFFGNFERQTFFLEKISSIRGGRCSE